MSYRKRFIEALAEEIGRRGLEDRDLAQDLDIARRRAPTSRGDGPRSLYAADR
jgi:hypothetical protein